jgi:hypothetical protein
MPPGIQGCHFFPEPRILNVVDPVKIIPAPKAHCHAIYGRPFPVTNLAV